MDNPELYEVSEKILALQHDLALVTDAWKAHHNIPRTHWGWNGNHDDLKRLKERIEADIQSWQVVEAHLNGIEAVNRLFR